MSETPAAASGAAYAPRGASPIGRGVTVSVAAHAAVLLGLASIARNTPRAITPPVYRVALVAAPAPDAGPPSPGTGASSSTTPSVSARTAKEPTAAKAAAVHAPHVSNTRVAPVTHAPVPPPPHAAPEKHAAVAPPPAPPHHVATKPPVAHAPSAPVPAPTRTAPTRTAPPHAVALSHPASTAEAARTTAPVHPLHSATPARPSTASSPPNARPTPRKVAAEGGGPTHTSPIAKPAVAAANTAPSKAATGSPTARGRDVADARVVGLEFPFPGYLDNLVRQVRLRFEPTAPRAGLHADLAFVVARDGSISGLRVVRSSGNYAFDLEAQGAVEAAGAAHAFGPLPDGFHAEHLPVTFSFDPHTAQ